MELIIIIFLLWLGVTLLWEGLRKETQADRDLARKFPPVKRYPKLYLIFLGTFCLISGLWGLALKFLPLNYFI